MKEECQNKNLIINILLERLFHTSTSKSLNTGNPDKSAKAVPDDCYEYPKKAAKTSKLKDQHKISIKTTNRFFCLITWWKSNWFNWKGYLSSDACKRPIQIDNSNGSHRTTSYKKLIKCTENINTELLLYWGIQS